MKKRPVMVFERVMGPLGWERQPLAPGTFLGFGVYFEELQNGVGQCTGAIVEFEDGRIGLYDLSLIQFLDRVEKKQPIPTGPGNE